MFIVALWKATNYDTGEEHIFCCRQCAEDYMVVHELEESDLHELDPTNKKDAAFIKEYAPYGCLYQCIINIKKG